MEKKRGATLTELCVILAIVSIVALVVVSFTAMISARSRTATARLNAMHEAQLVEAVMEHFIQQVTENGTVSVAVDGSHLTAIVDGRSCQLQLNEGNLTATLPDGTTSSDKLTTIENLQFSMLTNTTDTDEIYFCTLTYTVEPKQGAEMSETMVFSVNPRTGDIVGG